MTARADKEARATLRLCLAKERTHLRAGQWHGPPVEAVTSHGSVWDLHGTVCTCNPPCPERSPA
jgi:hypothetical protein